MAEELTGDALRHFLIHGTRTAKLACVRKDGRPVVSPVWFILDGEDIVFTTMNNTLKYRAIKREPRVSVCVTDDRYPFAFATLEGEACLQELPLDELLKWTTRIARRYVPEAQAAQFGKRNAVEGEVLVRIRISRRFAFQGIAD